MPQADLGARSVPVVGRIRRLRFLGVVYFLSQRIRFEMLTSRLACWKRELDEVVASSFSTRILVKVLSA